MAAVTLYKLTDAQGQTHGDGTNHTQWGAGVTHEAAGSTDGPLCSSSWIHAYEHPLVAVLLNPIHADLKNPQLWKCSGEIGKRDGPLKCGCRALTTVELLPLPEITTEQRVRFAIGCAWPQGSAAWKQWAADWLRGKDRTAAAEARAAAAEAAEAAAEAAAWAAEEAAAWAAEEAAAWAARAAAEAAEAAEAAAAAWAAAEAAAEAAEAAEAAAWAAEAAADFNLIAIAEWAISDQPIEALYPAEVKP